MRIRKDQHADFFIQAGRQLFEVHPVPPFFIAERIVHEDPSVILHGRKEGKVYGRLHDYFVSRPGESHYQKVQRRDHPRGKTDPLFLDLPTMPPEIPVHDGLKKGIGYKSITQRFMLKPLSDGPEDKVGCLKVHIRYPHGYYIGSSEYLASQIVFDGRRVFP